MDQEEEIRHPAAVVAAGGDGNEYRLIVTNIEQLLGVRLMGML